MQLEAIASHPITVTCEKSSDRTRGNGLKEAKRVTPFASDPCKSFPLGSRTLRQRWAAAQRTPRALSYRTEMVGQSTDTENAGFSISKLRHAYTALHRNSH